MLAVSHSLMPIMWNNENPHGVHGAAFGGRNPLESTESMDSVDFPSAPIFSRLVL